MKLAKEQMEIFTCIDILRQEKNSISNFAGKADHVMMENWSRQEPISQPGLVVSIHDVCPGTRASTERILADLLAVGVNKTSLLVIPNRHRSDPAFADTPESRDFCRWLLECSLAGHELVLHGYWHERVATHELSALDRMIAHSYTAGEGEFFDISEAQAISSLARGLREMEEALGVCPAGFIAPAWLLGTHARLAVQRFPFSYTTLLQGVWDLKESVFYSSQSLCYSIRAPWRRLCSRVWNSTLLRWLDDCPLVRVGLHPPDWMHNSIRSHALFCAERALVGRLPMTYESWVLRQRQQTLSNL